mgnify:FL=1|tara:strand:+ start:300 stop:560 length:261 start_codon:yes stop_codon:yes gene_type:complete
MRYLRHKIDGTIYEWNQILADNPKCEEVTEQQAYPEKFVPEARKGQPPRVDISVDVPAEIKIDKPELSQDAGRGLFAKPKTKKASE